MNFFFLLSVASLLATASFPFVSDNLSFLKESKNVFAILKTGVGEAVEKESAPVFTYEIKDEKNTIIKKSESPIYCSLKSLPEAWQNLLLGMKKKEIRKISIDNHHSLEVELIFPHVNPTAFPLPSVLTKRNLL